MEVRHAEVYSASMALEAEKYLTQPVLFIGVKWARRFGCANASLSLENNNVETYKEREPKLFETPHSRPVLDI